MSCYWLNLTFMQQVKEFQLQAQVLYLQEVAHSLSMDLHSSLLLLFWSTINLPTLHVTIQHTLNALWVLVLVVITHCILPVVLMHVVSLQVLIGRIFEYCLLTFQVHNMK